MNQPLRPRVVLLNPPSDHIAIRDNFCSKISQAAYINHPIDLVIQSGYLASAFTLHLLDAIIAPLTPDACLKRLIDIAPAAILSLAGNATWPDDIAFFRRLRAALPTCRLVVSGDVFLEHPEDVLRMYPEIDAITSDFTGPGVLQYLTNPDQPAINMISRRSD
ncbi:hypothetical protein JXA80_14055, partial [bacterium]|nr:hypothetical protein [candidate division CSSED10-310 bacterium]